MKTYILFKEDFVKPEIWDGFLRHLKPDIDNLVLIDADTVELTISDAEIKSCRALGHVRLDTKRTKE